MGGRATHTQKNANTTEIGRLHCSELNSDIHHVGYIQVKVVLYKDIRMGEGTVNYKIFKQSEVGVKFGVLRVRCVE